MGRDRDLRPGRGLPSSTSRSEWVWRDSAQTVSSPAGGFGVKVLDLDFGFGFGVGVRGLCLGVKVWVLGGTAPQHSRRLLDGSRD